MQWNIVLYFFTIFTMMLEHKISNDIKKEKLKAK